MSSNFPASGPNPFLAASQFLGNQYEKGVKRYVAVEKSRILSDALAMHKAHTDGIVTRETPTPGNTGAPIPGYRVRGPITPSTTGAPMPGTLKTKTSTNPVTGAAVKPLPIKPKGAKPTAPGTKPKQK